MSSVSPPRGRFIPDPIETTVRSSKRRCPSGSDTSPPPSDDASSIDSSVLVYRTKGYLSQSNEGVAGNAEDASVDDVVGRAQQDMHHMSIDNMGKPEQYAYNDDPVFPGHPTSRPVPSRRKFAPEPMETTSRSSKKEPQAKRRFAAEPVETTVRSSNNTKKEEEDSTQKDSGRPRRKFAPEPVETTTKSSKDKKETPNNDANERPKRKFAPQPVETTTRSSKEPEKKDEDTSKPKPRRKFLPQPVETSSEQRRRPAAEEQTQSPPASTTPSRSSSGGRKFSPELIETAKGSYRKQPPPPSVPKVIKPDGEEEQPCEDPEPEESRFSAAALARRSRSITKQHSYCIPDLPMIQSDSSDAESDEAEGDKSRTRSTSRSAARTPDSEAPTYTDYVLGLARKADQRKLREQVLAAYINEEDHVPVSHFAAEDDDDDSASVGKLSIEQGANPQLFRRMSHADLPLVLRDMQRHHEQYEHAKQEWEEDTAGASRFSAAALAARHHLGIHHPPGVTHGETHHEEAKPKPAAKEEEDPELAQMRAAASPPMQGGEIKFPFTISPKMTRCDVDQAPRPRRANSDDEETEYDIGHMNLWSAHVQIKKDASVGLWGGLCQKSSQEPSRPPTPIRSGIQTPAVESHNPFDSHTPGRGARTPGKRPTPWHGMSGLTPLTPARTNETDSFTAAIDQKLQLQKQIEEEFPNRVITQIYNYLSLGYPPLARPFDEELSKISRISVIELRKGDRSQSGNVKGFIGAPEGEGNGEEDDSGAVRSCRRWEALKLYVHEWARQSPNFTADSLANGKRFAGTDGWGANAPVRKGSWAH